MARASGPFGDGTESYNQALNECASFVKNGAKHGRPRLTPFHLLRLAGSFVALALMLSIAPTARAEKQIVKTLNQQFGKSLDEMKSQWPDNSSVEIRNGRTIFAHCPDPVFLSSPGAAAYSESTTLGSPGKTTSTTITTPGGRGPSGEQLPSTSITLGRNDPQTSTTVTVQHPEVPPTAIYLHTCILFSFDPGGTGVDGWQAFDYSTLDRHPREHPDWQIIDAWEVKRDQKGHAKPKRWGKFEGFWWAK
jgi:hypothetical protein